MKSPGVLLFWRIFIHHASPWERAIDSIESAGSEDVPAPTLSTFHLPRIELADFHAPAPANALSRPLCFYRKSDAKPVDFARQPTSSVRSHERRNAPEAPAPWFIARDTQLSD